MMTSTPFRVSASQLQCFDALVTEGGRSFHDRARVFLREFRGLQNHETVIPQENALELGHGLRNG
jgi:hypothetical protein